MLRPYPLKRIELESIASPAPAPRFFFTSHQSRVTSHFSVFAGALVCVARYHSYVRLNPSSKLTCGS
jgi:hypothetical protein